LEQTSLYGTEIEIFTLFSVSTENDCTSIGKSLETIKYYVRLATVLISKHNGKSYIFPSTNACFARKPILSRSVSSIP